MNKGYESMTGLPHFGSHNYLRARYYNTSNFWYKEDETHYYFEGGATAELFENDAEIKTDIHLRGFLRKYPPASVIDSFRIIFIIRGKVDPSGVVPITKQLYADDYVTATSWSRFGNASMHKK